MTTKPVGTYLRFLRKQNGLSQRRLAEILGSVSESQVSRHERSSGLPTILAALAYQAVFQKPVSEIFPGLYHTVEIGIEERLNELAQRLGSGGVDDTIKEFIARRASRSANWEFSD
jgi:transcriptional regulator with XRE-family HTH domain